MVAQGYAFVVGADDDVEEVLPPLVIPVGVTACVVALHKVVHMLAVAVAYAAVLAVDGRPHGIDRHGVDARQPHVLRPQGSRVGGNAHGRLYKVVVYAHPELAVRDDGRAVIFD